MAKEQRKWYVQHEQNAYVTFNTLEQMYKFVSKLKTTEGLFIWYGYYNSAPEPKNGL